MNVRPPAPWRRILRHLPLAIIVIFAAALRLDRIGHDSIWGDEALSWLIARMSLPDLIRHVIWWEQIPPAHHLLLWLWIRIFGASELSLRMPSALAGVMAVVAMFVFVRRMLDTRAGLAAAVVLAAAPLHVAYAQEARAYALTFFVAIVCTDLFVRLLRQPTQRLQVTYVLTAALLLYCHLYGAFVLAAHQVAYFAALGALPRPALRLKRWLTLSIAIAALYSPWAPTVVRWMRAVNINFWVKAVTFDDISRAYWVLSGSTPLYILFIALSVIGTMWVFRHRRDMLVLLLALTLLPVIVPVTLSVIGRPSFAPRYAIVACVGLYPLLAAGIATLPLTAFRVGVLVLIVALGMAGLRGEAVVIAKSPWRQAIAYVEAHAQPRDIAVVHIKAKTRMYDYYTRRPELPRRGFDSAALPLSTPLDEGRRVWFIRHEEWAPLREQLERGGWHVVSHKWFGDILVMELSDRDDTRSTAPQRH